MSRIASIFKYFYQNGGSESYNNVGDNGRDRYLQKKALDLGYWHDERD